MNYLYSIMTFSCFNLYFISIHVYKDDSKLSQWT